MQMELTYIYHNCFLLNTGIDVMLFDYPRFRNGKTDVVALVERIVRGKTLHLFVSHSHPDHYDPIIYEWADRISPVLYHLGDDINPADVPEKQSPFVSFYSDGSSTSHGNLTIHSLRSNDQGVAFQIETSRYHIYYGGDLADWTWDDFTLEHRARIEQIFQSTLNHVSGSKVDLAFSNADPRLPNFSGAVRFAAAVQPGLFVPMHLFGKTSVLKDLETQISKIPCKMFRYSTSGDSIVIDV